ncbi:MAG: methyltransferase domain-containing protein [Candidatus Moraniibacteriota bacterium]
MSIAHKISAFNRNRKWKKFQSLIKIDAKIKILDVGFSNEEYSAMDNFIEKKYPFPENITALGVDSSEKFHKNYPLVSVVTYNGIKMPFIDNQFDVAWSNATLEHVGDAEKQVNFLREIVRVSRKVFLTTPNRNFPFEVHTHIPLMHIFLAKKYFDKFLCLIGKGWASGDYMHLLTISQVKSLLKEAGIKNYQIIKNKLLFFTVDFIVFIDEKEKI